MPKAICIEFIVTCNECGATLDGSYVDSDCELYIDPCYSCMDNAEENGRDMGWQDGYAEGYDEGIEVGGE